MKKVLFSLIVACSLTIATDATSQEFVLRNLVHFDAQHVNEKNLVAGYFEPPNSPRELAIWDEDSSVLTRIGPPPVSNYFFIFEFNDLGQMLVGIVDPTDRDYILPYVVTHEGWKPLDMNGNRCRANIHINDRGEVVGLCDDEQGYRKTFFVSSSGDWTELDPFTSFIPLAMNDRGEVVGWRPNWSGGRETRPVFWDKKNGVVELDPGLFNSDSSYGFQGARCTGINNKGEIVGHFNVVNNNGYFLGRRPFFLSKNDELTVIDDDPGDYDYDFYWLLNERGQTTLNKDGKSYLWDKKGGLQEFVPLDGALGSFLADFNERDQTVGSSAIINSEGYVLSQAQFSDGGNYALGFLDKSGQNPNSLRSFARRINNHGLVIGEANNSANVDRSFTCDTKARLAFTNYGPWDLNGPLESWHMPLGQLYFDWFEIAIPVEFDQEFDLYAIDLPISSDSFGAIATIDVTFHETKTTEDLPADLALSSGEVNFLTIPYRENGYDREITSTRVRMDTPTRLLPGQQYWVKLYLQVLHPGSYQTRLYWRWDSTGVPTRRWVGRFSDWRNEEWVEYPTSYYLPVCPAVRVLGQLP